jgi:hypothetical protein
MMYVHPPDLPAMHALFVIHNTQDDEAFEGLRRAYQLVRKRPKHFGA